MNCTHYYNGEVVRTHTIIPTDTKTRLNYNKDDVIQILRSDFKKDASDDEVVAFMRE